jgi:hypothetical protein
LSDRLCRVKDGVVYPIPPSEYIAWLQATGEIVYPTEYAILCAMDDAFCNEMGKELSDYNERSREGMNSG